MILRLSYAYAMGWNEILSRLALLVSLSLRVFISLHSPTPSLINTPISLVQDVLKYAVTATPSAGLALRVADKHTAADADLQELEVPLHAGIADFGRVVMVVQASGEHAIHIRSRVVGGPAVASVSLGTIPVVVDRDPSVPVSLQLHAVHAHEDSFTVVSRGDGDDLDAVFSCP